MKERIERRKEEIPESTLSTFLNGICLVKCNNILGKAQSFHENEKKTGRQKRNENR